MSPSMTSSVEAPSRSLYAEMKAIVGAENVAGGTPERRRKIRTGRGRRQGTRELALDFSIDDVVPGIVVSPGSAEEVAAIMRKASEHDYVIVPAGGMTKQKIGAIPEHIDILLRTNR